MLTERSGSRNSCPGVGTTTTTLRDDNTILLGYDRTVAIPVEQLLQEYLCFSPESKTACSLKRNLISYSIAKAREYNLKFSKNVSGVDIPARGSYVFRLDFRSGKQKLKMINNRHI